jgi:hypothetical protein
MGLCLSRITVQLLTASGRFGCLQVCIAGRRSFSLTLAAHLHVHLLRGRLLLDGRLRAHAADGVPMPLHAAASHQWQREWHDGACLGGITQLLLCKSCTCSQLPASTEVQEWAPP